MVKLKVGDTVTFIGLPHIPYDIWYNNTNWCNTLQRHIAGTVRGINECRTQILIRLEWYPINYVEEIIRTKEIL